MNEFPKTFMSVREIAKTGVLPETVLRKFQRRGELPGFYSGRKYLVNTAILADRLADPDSPFNSGRRDS